MNSQSVTLPADNSEASLAGTLRRLLQKLSRRRRLQLGGVFVLMILGAFAELMAIGAVLPFLSLIANPEGAANLPFVGSTFARISSREWSIQEIATWGFILAAALAGIVRLLLVWISQKFVFRLAHDIGTAVFARALSQPYTYYLSRNSSVLLADVEKVQIVTLNVLLPLMNAASSLVISIFILAALVSIDPLVALTTATGFGFLYLLISLVFRGKLRTNSQVISRVQAGRIRTVQEGTSAIRDILIDQSQPIYERRFAELDLRLRDTQASNAFLGAAPRFVIEACGMILIALMALSLSGRPGGIAAALPVLGALALGAIRLMPLMQLTYNGWSQIAGNRQSLFDIVTALDLPLAPRSTGSTEPLPFKDSIRFQGVSYAYPTASRPVLQDFSLSIPRGSRIGIVGKTGSGKSTLMDMVLGLLSPTTGQILIDGIPLDTTTRAAWQARIAHVPQSIYLSDSSVAENIAFGVGSAEIDMDKVHLAAEQAALADFVMSLPEGYATFVGERGVRLSGGQRQRIGIARALYRNADVLVLDEATSALDNETEAAVMDAVERLSEDLTIFLIAHRVTTLRNCDRIVEMPQGRIVSYTDLPENSDAQHVADRS